MTNDPYFGYLRYGPYLSTKINRMSIKLQNNDKKLYMYYSRYLMEMHLGRRLNHSEQVDHIDGNRRNDNLTNLRLTTQSNHRRSHCQTLKQQVFICPNCNNSFILSGRRLSAAYHDRLRGKSGPYCSQSCAGIAKNRIGRNQKQYEIATIVKEYYVPHDQMQGVK